MPPLCSFFAENGSVIIEHNIEYSVEGFKINLNQRQVISAQQTINVRPKTFSLLLQFLEQPFEVLSKDYLLEKIWDDVAVEEQVLVQSIRELRQIFSPLDIIQTHPRKGYAWVVPVEKLDAKELEVKPSFISNSDKRFKALIVSGVLMLIMLAVVALQYKTNESAKKNIITVLPVNNLTEGSGLSWARLGMMDQIIQSLESSPNVQVFDVSYMLQLINSSGVDSRNRLQLVKRIFELSGSNLIVDLELSGSVKDYRLLYRLYTKDNQTSGVIAEDQLDKLIEKLAGIISTKTDARLDFSHLNAEFNSGLLAEAVEKWNQKQTAAAVSLLETAITIEPNNFLAHQFLLEFKEYLGDWSQLIVNVKQVIAVAEQHQHDRVYVFYYLLAKAEFAQRNFEQARHNLVIAQKLAEQNFDSLYQAYIASLWGDIALKTDFEKKTDDGKLAEIFYQRAIGHHQSIDCPIGVSLVRLQLIELYTVQKKYELAIEQLNLLKVLIEKHKLPLELPVLPEV